MVLSLACRLWQKGAISPHRARKLKRNEIAVIFDILGTQVVTCNILQVPRYYSYLFIYSSFTCHKLNLQLEHHKEWRSYHFQDIEAWTIVDLRHWGFRTFFKGKSMADDRTCLFNGPSRFLIGSNGDWEDDRRAVASERLEDHLVQWHFFCLLLHRSTGLIRHLPFYHGRKFQYSSGLGGIHFWFESDSLGRPRGNSNRHRLAKQIVAMVCCIGHFGRCSINCWNWLGQFPDHLRLSVHIWSLLCNTEHCQFCLVLWFYPTGFPSEVVVTSEHRESARLRRWSILQPFSVCILWKWMATCLKFLAYGVHPVYPVDTRGGAFLVPWEWSLTCFSKLNELLWKCVWFTKFYCI